MNASWFCRAALLFFVVSTATSAQDASGRFEVYCDGIGFFLARIDGAPAPGKLLLFLYTGFPASPYWTPKEEWKDVAVFRDGCAADGKCEVFARGDVWLDNEITREGKRVSGKYKIELNGRHLQGQFATKLHLYKDPPRICE